jgi:hypothetical protein
MRLQKVFQNVNDRNELTEVLQVTVEFDQESRTVGDVISIKALATKRFKDFDLTELFINHLPDQLDAIVDSIDWDEVYLDWQLNCEMTQILSTNKYSHFQNSSL